MSAPQPRHNDARPSGGPSAPGGPGGPGSGGRPGGAPNDYAAAPGRPAAEHPTSLLGGNRLRIVAGLAIGLFVLILGLVGYFAWNSIAYVETLNARIEAPLSVLRAPTAGRVVELPLEVGDQAAAHEELVILEALGATGRVLVPLRAPHAGVVTERAVKVGDTVQAGQVLVSVVDVSQLWVTANVHESRIPQVQVGQNAHVWINTRTVRRDFWGHVAQLGRATNTALATVRGQDTSTPRPAEVPVRISLDSAGYELYPGMTAEVWIRLNPRLW